MSELVYCVAAPDERTYEAASAAYDRFWKGRNNLFVRSSYPSTGWTMDELVGSQWVSIHCGDVRMVTRVSSEPNLIAERKVLGLGHWWMGRFVIENYIRHDVLTPAEQLTWAVWRATCCQKEVDRANDNYQRLRNDPLNANSKKYWLREQRKELQQALDELQAFCEQHGFAPGAEYVNAGINQSAEPVQMRLFI